MIGHDRLTGVSGSFEHMDSLEEAVLKLGEVGLDDIEVFSPVPRHELEHLMQPAKSPVRFVTFTGALVGLTFGFFMAIATSLIWNLIVAGKPIVSIPAFVVIGFECTILIGALFNLFGILWLGGVPAWRHPGYDGRFSDDRFGLYVNVPVGRLDEAHRLMVDHHAEMCWRVAGGVRTELALAAEGGEA